MKYLFSTEGLQALDECMREPSVYALDFDGTLAPITAFPEGAWMRPATQVLLEHLAGLDVVAVISGRALADLRKRVPFKNVFLVGNHGVESEFKDYTALQKQAEEVCLHWRSNLLQLIVESSIGPSIELEDKKYSFSLHYRRSTNYSYCVDELMRIAGQLQPLPRIVQGKAVLNLLPPDLPHKGNAVVDLMKHTGLSQAFFIGDDATDEDVFNHCDKSVFTIRVGFAAESAAEYYIRDQAEIEKLLSFFVRGSL